MKNVAARGDDYVLENIQKAVAELVYPKYRLQKMYNYYNGFRDPEQYRYLEENYGIGNPTSVEFTPLIRKHIDVLIGEYLSMPILPKVSCKDKETISKITREKELKISEEVFELLRQKLNSNIVSFITNRKTNVDSSVEGAINKLVEDINNNFVSNYEVAAQNVVEYILQSRSTDFKNKLKYLLLDLLVTGSTYYKVKPSVSETNIDIEVLNPLNTFVDRNPDSMYVKDSYRAVIRKWLSKQQILNKYGAKLSKEAIKEIRDMDEGGGKTSAMYIRSMENQCTGRPLTGGLEAGVEVVPGYPIDSYNVYSYRLIPVYEVEWVDVDLEDGEYIMNRYEGVKIGESIYVLTGKSDNVIRTKDNPTHCTLSLNGIYFVNRGNEPYSLVEACMTLQDKYDITIFFRDNLLANSGTKGDWVDVSMLPTFLGTSLAERLEKFNAYKKAGQAIIDTSQEGRAFNNNTSFAGFDDSIQVNTIQAFELVLDRLENTCSSITGVFRERLNGIQQRDAVSNVQVGIQNSYMVTRQYFDQLDTLTTDILIDSLNIGKIVWKKGLTGTLVLGDILQRTFISLPEHFTITDYDIHIQPTSELNGEMKMIQQTIFEFIKSGGLDPDIIIDALTSKSLTDLKAKVNKAFLKRKSENENISQLQQQFEQAQQQLQQLQAQNQQLQAKIESLNEAKIQLEQAKLQTDSDIRWYEARTNRDFKQTTAENDSKKVSIEEAQLYDGNPYNDKIRE